MVIILLLLLSFFLLLLVKVLEIDTSIERLKECRAACKV